MLCGFIGTSPVTWINFSHVRHCAMCHCIMFLSMAAVTGGFITLLNWKTVEPLQLILLSLTDEGSFDIDITLSPG